MLPSFAMRLNKQFPEALHPKLIFLGTTSFCRKFWKDLTLNELSGSLGDLGTFLPLTVGLAQKVGLDFGTALIFTGIYNIITGALFGIPLPVQPMKTIAAVALSENLTIPQIMAAGIFVGGTVMLLGALQLMGLASRLIPLSVIKGMQLGLGLNLAMKGFDQVWYANSKDAPTREWWGVEGLFLGLFALIFILLTVYQSKVEDGTGCIILPKDSSSELRGGGEAEEEVDVEGDSPRRPLLSRIGDIGVAAERRCSADVQELGPKIPAALVLVIIGIVSTLIAYPDVVDSLSFGPSKIVTVVPNANEWKQGIIRAGLPQLPLTTFNSVISVCQLAGELFPERAPPSPNSVAFSVGAMNLFGGWFGALPACHGAGGLAAQTRFGARTGAAPMFLGMVKIFLGLLFGSSMVVLFNFFPDPILGAMLVYAGIELAACSKNQKGTRGMAVMLLTAVISLALNNVAGGVAGGLIAAYVLFVYDISLAFAFSLYRKSRGSWTERRNGRSTDSLPENA